MFKMPFPARLRTVIDGFLATLAAAFVGLAPAAAADAYPQRAVTLVVPFPAGGTTDVIARGIAQALSRQLGQPVVVENKAGAGGVLGTVQVLHAPADGYTLLWGGQADQINAPLLMARPPYNSARDFEPVGCAVRAPNVLVVGSKVGVQSIGELIRLAKASPDKMNFASSGNGSTSHLLGEMLAASAGIKISHVPYRGNAPAITDLLSGQIQMMFSSPVAVEQHVKSGALRALATTSGARLASLPNVPTLRESRIPIEVYSWNCMFVPAKTPDPVVNKLHDALMRALDDPAVAQSMEKWGGEKFAPSRNDARRFMAAEQASWTKLIRARHIQAD